MVECSCLRGVKISSVVTIEYSYVGSLQVELL